MLDSSLLTLLIGFLAGYLLQSNSYPFSFRYLRLSGYRSLFEAILWSLPFLIAGRLICSSIGHQWPTTYKLWHRHFPLPWLGTALMAVGLSTMVVYLTNFIFEKRGQGRSQSLARAITLFGNELEKLISESVSLQELLQVTLDSRKVYIGRALVPDVEDSQLSHVELIPILSGHRDSSDLRLVIDTDYFAAYESLLDEDDRDGLEEVDPVNLEDLRIVIPISRVVSISTFREEIFQLTDVGPHSAESEMPPTGGETKARGPFAGEQESAQAILPQATSEVASPWRRLLASILEFLASRLRVGRPPSDFG